MNMCKGRIFNGDLDGWLGRSGGVCVYMVSASQPARHVGRRII